MTVPTPFAYVEPPTIPEGMTTDEYRRVACRAAKARGRRGLALALLYPLRLIAYYTERGTHVD
jgi:hypothetical protein